MTNVWENDFILLKSKELVHLIYKITRTFPAQEKFGVTSQLRRAALSICLNMVEGYSRFRIKPHVHFLEISFGSLKETQFLLQFCLEEKMLTNEEFQACNNLCEEISKMLYAKIQTLKSRQRH